VHVVTRSTLVAIALAALPAGAAMAQTSTTVGPYVPPGTGMSSGVPWTTVDLGTCSMATGTATVNGSYAGCNNEGVGSPLVAVSAFGQVWAAGAGPYDPSQAEAFIEPIALTSTTVSPTVGKTLTGFTAPRAGVVGGSYMWLAGSTAQGSNGVIKAMAVGVDSTGTVRKRYAASSGAVGAGGLSIAYGTSKVWVGDALGRVYALSPSSGKLLMTIKTASPHGLAVSGSTLWVTNPSARTVKVFNTSSGAQRTSITVTGAPNAVVVTGGSVWVFTQKYLYRYSPSSLKQTGRYAAPPSGSGWLGAAAGPGGIWASNYVAQIVRFNTSTLTFDVNATWSNSNIAGPLASAGGSLWVPNTGSSPSPVGHSVTRFTPVS